MTAKKVIQSFLVFLFSFVCLVRFTTVFGVIYIVIINLPRSIRFKRENVILCGIIPGPIEPSLTINSYLSPIVSDLEKLWKGVELQKAGESSKTMIGCVLLGVACRGVLIIGSAIISATEMVIFTNIGIDAEQQEDRYRY